MWDHGGFMVQPPDSYGPYRGAHIVEVPSEGAAEFAGSFCQTEEIEYRPGTNEVLAVGVSFEEGGQVHWVKPSDLVLQVPW